VSQTKNLPATASQSLKNLNEQLAKSKAQLAVALGRNMEVDHFIRVALTVWRMRPDLQECSVVSIMGSLMQAAQLGLDVDGQLGHAYLVPFWNKKAGCKDAQLITGYRGLAMLAERFGKVAGAPEMRAVFEGDDFDYAYGLDQRLIHRPKGEEDPAKLTNVYTIVRFKDTDVPLFDVMDRSTVDRHKARSKASSFGPWVTDYVAMAKKTVLRRALKSVPMAVSAQRQVAREEAWEAGVELPDADLLPVADSDPTQHLEEKLRVEAKEVEPRAPGEEG
jgi:recombination protein RecT